MTKGDRTFALGTLALSVIVPGLLLWLRLFGETREELGLLAGWGAALVVMVPSYVLLRRTLHSDNQKHFLGGFLGGSLGRMVLTVVAVLWFVTQVPDAPKWSFILSYFLGYFLLTALEVVLLAGRQPNGSAA